MGISRIHILELLIPVAILILSLSCDIESRRPIELSNRETHPSVGTVPIETKIQKLSDSHERGQEAHAPFRASLLELNEPNSATILLKWNLEPNDKKSVVIYKTDHSLDYRRFRPIELIPQIGERSYSDIAIKPGVKYTYLLQVNKESIGEVTVETPPKDIEFKGDVRELSRDSRNHRVFFRKDSRLFIKDFWFLECDEIIVEPGATIVFEQAAMDTEKPKLPEEGLPQFIKETARRFNVYPIPGAYIEATSARGASLRIVHEGPTEKWVLFYARIKYPLEKFDFSGPDAITQRCAVVGNRFARHWDSFCEALATGSLVNKMSLQK